MAIKAPIELYRRSIPEGLKTKDLFFVALQDMMTTRTGIIPWILTANLKGR